MALTRLLAILTILGHREAAKAIKTGLEEKTLMTNRNMHIHYKPIGETKPLAEQFNSILWDSIPFFLKEKTNMPNIHQQLLNIDKKIKNELL